MIKPVVEFPPTTLSTAHVTEVLVVPETVAVNCKVKPAATLTDDCPSVMLIEGGVVG